MGESATTHIWMLFFSGVVPVIMIIGLWIDWRIRSGATKREQERQHQENREDLVEIKTQLKPIWEWWQKRINGNGTPINGPKNY